jgi:hypothetical protein
MAEPVVMASDHRGLGKRPDADPHPFNFLGMDEIVVQLFYFFGLLSQLF